MKIINIGEGKPSLAIVGCLHGDEHLGKEVIDELYDLNIDKGSLKLIIAHEEALSQNKRYIDNDLNQSFYECAVGLEGALAKDILQELQGIDYVVDIHQTTAKTDNFVITTRTNNNITRMINYSLLNKSVYIAFKRAKNSLISNVESGISLEFNRYTPLEETMDSIHNILAGCGLIDQPVNYNENVVEFTVTDVLSTKATIQPYENFVESKFNNKKFYPVLYGEVAYAQINCLMAYRF